MGCGTQWKRLHETLPLSTHNTYFTAEKKRISTENLSSARSRKSKTFLEMSGTSCLFKCDLSSHNGCVIGLVQIVFMCITVYCRAAVVVKIVGDDSFSLAICEIDLLALLWWIFSENVPACNRSTYMFFCWMHRTKLQNIKEKRHLIIYISR